MLFKIVKCKPVEADAVLLPADPRTRSHHSFKFKHIHILLSINIHLGPLLFVLYINDIDDSISSKILKFADQRPFTFYTFTFAVHSNMQS